MKIGGQMSNWEYFTTILEADVKQQSEKLKARCPDVPFQDYSPQALIPQLDEIGEKRWELVSLQPVIVGTNAELLLIQPGAVLPAVVAKMWTHSYLCSFKRPKPE
jgi:hypothetical protein